MSDRSVDIRTVLAASAYARVELDQDGMLHVRAGAVTLQLDRSTCEELTTTLARAMVGLASLAPKRRRPTLALVPAEE